MQVGEVRVAKAEDFEKFERLVDQREGWTLQYNKHATEVYTRITEGSNIKMIKVFRKDDEWLICVGSLQGIVPPTGVNFVF